MPLPREEIEEMLGEYDEDGYYILDDGGYYDLEGYYVPPEAEEAAAEEEVDATVPLSREEIEYLDGTYDDDGFYHLKEGGFYDPYGYYFDKDGKDAFGGKYDSNTGEYVPGAEYKEEYK